MMGDHQEGLSFIKNVAIDQHVLARNRQFDMFKILKEHPELLGLGIDEDTAIVVQGNEFEVIGENYVLVYDGTFWSREGSSLKTLPEKANTFYFLRKGDKYDLLNRKVKQ
jgi:cyanophycinase